MPFHQDGRRGKGIAIPKRLHNTLAGVLFKGGDGFVGRQVPRTRDRAVSKIRCVVPSLGIACPARAHTVAHGECVCTIPPPLETPDTRAMGGRIRRWTARPLHDDPVGELHHHEIVQRQGLVRHPTGFDHQECPLRDNQSR